MFRNTFMKKNFVASITGYKILEWDCILTSTMTSSGPEIIIKMSLELFHKVPAGVTETLFDEQNQPYFERADLGKYLSIKDIKHNFKNFPSHYTHPRLDLERGGLTLSTGREKNPHDIFINLDGSIEMTVRSKKPKTAALVKRLTKKGVEKIQEEHQQAIKEKDATIAHCKNQMQALKFTNEKHQRKILRLSEEIKDLIAYRYVARRGFLTTCCTPSKRIAKRFTHITLFDVSIDSFRNISSGLNLVTQTWRWLTNGMIQMPFIDGTGLSVK